MFKKKEEKNKNGRYEFNVYYKPALTNVQIKKHNLGTIRMKTDTKCLEKMKTNLY